MQCTVAKSVMQYSAMYLRVHIIECNVAESAVHCNVVESEVQYRQLCQLTM